MSHADLIRHDGDVRWHDKMENRVRNNKKHTFYMCVRSECHIEETETPVATHLIRDRESAGKKKGEKGGR